jgi:flagellar biosynthesis/type III secretory pathway protein FliH
MAFRTNWKRKATEMRTELHRARHDFDVLKVSYEYSRQELNTTKTSHETLNAQLAAAVIQHDQDKNRLTGLADNWKTQAIKSRWEGFEAGKESGFNEGKKCGETEGRKKARIAIDAVIKSTCPLEDIPGQGIAQPKPGSLSSQSLSSMGSSSDAASREARG